jgi:chromosome segregation protein
MPPGSRCLTPAGDVLWSVGALSSGQFAPDDAGLRRQELRAQLEQIEGRYRDIEQRRQNTAGHILALETQLRTVAERAIEARGDAAWRGREAIAQARSDLAVAQQALLSARDVLERESALLARLDAQVAARQTRTRQLKDEHTSLLAVVERLGSETAAAREKLHALQRRIRPAQERVDRLLDELSKAAGEEQRVRVRLRDAEARHGQSGLEVERCRDRLRLLAQRVEEDLGLVELDLGEDVTAQTPLPLRPLVTELPIVEDLPEGLEDELLRLRTRLHSLRRVNPNAPAEYEKTKQRYEFLSTQSEDLRAAVRQLRQVVEDLDEMMEAAFRTTFSAVAAEFSEVFARLFGGGRARLEMTDNTDLMSTGVDIVAQPPGKRAQRLGLLSGGERALTATALLFSLLKVSPTPFCVLDEVDAMLDEANVERFRALLAEMSEDTQFVVITHNRVTVEAADAIYGVSMGSDGVSKVVSLRVD